MRKAEGTRRAGGRSRRFAIGVAAVVALVGAATAYAHKVTVDGTVLQGGGTSRWDPASDAYTCVSPLDGNSPFVPVFNGGTATRSGPFGGGFAVFVNGVNGAPLEVPSGKGNLTGRSLTVGPDSAGGLKVSMTEAALTTPSLRMLVKFKNPRSGAVHRTIAVVTSLNYDPGVELTSDGASHVSKKSRWAITSDVRQNPGYAPATQVWYGKHASTPVKAIDHPGGSTGCFENDFQLKVPPHGTSYLMLFAEQNKSVNAAKKSAKKFNQRQLTKRLLGGIKSSVRKRIVNWSLK